MIQVTPIHKNGFYIVQKRVSSTEQGNPGSPHDVERIPSTSRRPLRRLLSYHLITCRRVVVGSKKGLKKIGVEVFIRSEVSAKILRSIPLTGHVTHSPRLDHMSYCSNQSEEDTQRSCGDVRPTKECILASDPGDRRDHDRFSATELLDRVI